MELNLSMILLGVIIVFAIFALVISFYGARIKKKWDAASMYNVASCLVVASIISGTISFLAIWIALPNNKSIAYTHQDVVVDILGILVTVLIGWNIFTVVDIKRKAESIAHISNDLEKIMSSILQMSIHSFTIRSDKEAVINSCFLSLDKAIECENDSVRSSAIKEIMKLLHQIRGTYKNGDKICIYNGTKEYYNSVLWNIDDVYRDEICEMIINASELITSGEDIKFAESSSQSDSTYEASKSVN